MTNGALSEAKGLTIPGILLIILGVVAIATPAVAGTAVVYVIGVLLILAGIVEFVHGLKADSWTHKLMPIVLGVLYVICGLGVVAHPMLGLGFLTLLLAVYFLVEGLWKIIASFKYRPNSGWLMILASGVITLLLGWIIWKQWPLSGMWAVGILVGVDMLLTGVALVALASTARKLEKVMATSQPT